MCDSCIFPCRRDPNVFSEGTTAPSKPEELTVSPCLPSQGVAVDL